MRIIYSTQHGIEKNESEDAILINTDIYTEAKGIIEVKTVERIAIADGVGGNKGGKDAAKYLLNAVSKLEFDEDGSLHTVFREINSVLIKQAKILGEKSKMATTFTGLIKCANDMYIVHVGNTRLYVRQGSYLRQITHDHTTYQFFLDRGIEEMADSCNRSEIQACFGGGKESYLELIQINKVFTERFPKRIIFTTDGIHDYVSIDKMEELLTKTENIEESLNLLNELAIRNGSKDDRTIVVIENM